MSVTAAKRLVWDFWRSLRGGAETELVIAGHCSADVEWHGFQPIRRASGASDVAGRVWAPLLDAIGDLERHPYILLGGEFEGSTWVGGTGELAGTFSGTWLGIPGAGRSVRFRFGEFCKVEGGRIAEIRMLLDLPDLARQAGRRLLPSSSGRDLPVPGPLTNDGVLLCESDAAESADTLGLVETMIFDGLNRYDGHDQASQDLERFWHDEMAWYGPVGLGTSLGLEEFTSNAQGPIVRAYPDRRGVGHVARIGDGAYAASTGWPSLVGTHEREFLGWAPTGEVSRWNIMDFWRREGDKLAENWVLVDLVDVARQAGVDLLEQ